MFTYTCYMKSMHTPASITTLVLLLSDATTISDDGDSKSCPNLDQKCLYLTLLLCLSCSVRTLLGGCLHVWVPLCVFPHTGS